LVGALVGALVGVPWWLGPGGRALVGALVGAPVVALAGALGRAGGWQGVG
jgi:hypothetical protein